MIESIAAIFTGLASVTATAQAFQELLEREKGNSRALLEELKENLGLCWLVLDRGTDPLKIIPELRTSEYDRILKTGFDFNSLNRKKIQATPELLDSDLSSFVGKETEDLIVNIYDKTKALKRIYRVDRDNPKIWWRRRVINLHKRILLLLQHLRTPPGLI